MVTDGDGAQGRNAERESNQTLDARKPSNAALNISNGCDETCKPDPTPPPSKEAQKVSGQSHAHYKPELGQMCFGQGWQEFPVPELMTAALDAIGDEIERVVGNVTQDRRENNPRHNNASAFRCEGLGMWAYSWGDNDQPYNFYHVDTGVMVSWYKYGGRGESCNVQLPPDLINTILETSLKAIRACESDEFYNLAGDQFKSGFIGEVPYFHLPLPGASHD